MKILLVEDEPDVCSAIQSYLGKRGFQVSTTTNGKEALQMIKIVKPALVILDFMLNELDGRDVLKELRAYDKKTKIIIITGQLLPKRQKQKIINLGVTEYLNKPVLLKDLENVISRTLNIEIKAKSNIKRRSIKKSTKGSDATHKLINCVSVIRTKCENFVLNNSEGIYKNKSSEELMKKAIEIMTEVVDTVDQTVEVIDAISEEERS